MSPSPASSAAAAAMATSTAPLQSGRKETPTNLTEIPDHLVAEFFLRLPSAEDLARASAACVSFRRLVTDKSFLRRFRRLHDPPLLGLFDVEGLHHALPPHPSAPKASALAAAADFSFSFFPNHRQWDVQDIRDGRVLLTRLAGGNHPQVSTELAVCDPLHRVYALLPPIPDDLAASVAHPASAHKRWCDAFFLPLDEEAETAFAVIWMAHFDTRLATLVYSSTTKQWLPAASKGWNELFLERGESTMVPPFHPNFQAPLRCFYWRNKELLVFDTRRMEFSISDLPHKGWCASIAIVEAGEGRLGLFGIFRGTSDGMYDLCYYIKGNRCESSSQWQLERTISLGSGWGHDIKAATGRYLLLGKFVSSTTQVPDLEYITVDLKTWQLETVCSKSCCSGAANVKTWIYTKFPLWLSSPTI